jgi:hypothetical protein
LPRLALYHDPPHLCLINGWDYKHLPPYWYISGVDWIITNSLLPSGYRSAHTPFATWLQSFPIEWESTLMLDLALWLWSKEGLWRWCEEFCLCFDWLGSLSPAI